MRWENGALVQGRTMQNPCRSLALRAPLAVEDSLLALRRLGFEPPDPVLPAPLGPSRPTTSPGSTYTDTPRTTSVLP